MVGGMTRASGALAAIVALGRQGLSGLVKIRRISRWNGVLAAEPAVQVDVGAPC